MNEIQGYYYLHVNNSLIYKCGSDSIIDIRDSDFCRSAWAWDGTPQNAWQICVEALSLGVDRKRIFELAEKWNVNDSTAQNYADYVGINLGMDGNQMTATRKDFDNLQESDCGFGDTYLEAMADLCEQQGFKGGKMWNSTFKDLINL